MCGARRQRLFHCATVSPFYCNLLIAIVNSPKRAASSALFPSLLGPKRPSAAHHLIRSFRSRCLVALSGSAWAVPLHMWHGCGGCLCVHMNNALLYSGTVKLYSYCNVYSYKFRENSRRLSCVQKAVLSCNKVDIFLRFYGLFYARRLHWLLCFTYYRLNTSENLLDTIDKNIRPHNAINVSLL